MPKTIKFKDSPWLLFKNKQSDAYPIFINTTGYYDASTPFETHNTLGRHDYYLIYVIEGELTVFENNKSRELNTGSAVLIPPNHPYRYRGNSSTHYLYVHFTGSYAEQFLADCGFKEMPVFIEGKVNNDIKNRFNQMIDVFFHNEVFAGLKCAYMLQEILVYFAQLRIDRSFDLPLKASIKHIHNFYTEKIKIPYLAKLENLSNSRYIAVFKSIMGKSPNEYIIDLRLQFAKNLIENTNMSIRQISEWVGYTDQYFFSRLFKKHFGVSPQGYRKENKNDRFYKINF